MTKKFGDARGFFSETFSRPRFAESGIDIDWVQDNQSFSAEQGVLRGLHFQVSPYAQDKLVRVLRGSIFDVRVDLRQGSPTYGKWKSCVLSAQHMNQLLVPKGFAHGFLTLEPGVEVFYKVSAPYSPDMRPWHPLGRSVDRRRLAARRAGADPFRQGCRRTLPCRHCRSHFILAKRDRRT